MKNIYQMKLAKRNAGRLAALLAFFLLASLSTQAQCDVQQDAAFGPDPCEAKIYCSNSGAAELFITCTPAADTDGEGIDRSFSSIPGDGQEPTDPCYIPGYHVQWIKFATPAGVNAFVFDVDNTDYWALYYTFNPDACGLGSLTYLTCGDQAATNGFLSVTNPNPNIGPQTVVYYYIGFYFEDLSQRNANFKTKDCESVVGCDPVINCPAPLSVSCSNTGAITQWLNSATFDNCGQNGNVVNNYSPTAFNGCGGTGTQTVTFSLVSNGRVVATCTSTITKTDNMPPTGICPPGQNGLPSLDAVPAPNPQAIAANYSDNCSGVTVTFAGATQTGNACMGYTVTHNYLISDGCGNTATCSVVYRVNGQGGLTGSCPPAVTNLQCWDDVPSGQAGVAIVQAAYSTPSGIPPIVLYLGTSGFNNYCSFSFNHIYQVLDPCNGNRAICVLRYSGQDFTPPSGSCPAGGVVDCIDDVPAPNPLAVAAAYTDNCSTPFAYLISTNTQGSGCASFSVTYNYRVYDDCDNFSTCSVAYSSGGGALIAPGNTGSQQMGALSRDAHVYPNPTNGMVNIEMAPSYSEQGQLEVFNAFGQQMFSQVLDLSNPLHRIDLAAKGLPGGAYVLVIRAGEEVVTKRVVLNNR